MSKGAGGKHDGTKNGHKPYDPNKVERPKDDGGKHGGGSSGGKK